MLRPLKKKVRNLKNLKPCSPPCLSYSFGKSPLLIGLIAIKKNYFRERDANKEQDKQRNFEEDWCFHAYMQKFLNRKSLTN